MTPLILTLAANIDKKGRWAAIAGGVFFLGTAFGPVVGAMLMEGMGYEVIAWFQWLAALPYDADYVLTLFDISIFTGSIIDAPNAPRWFGGTIKYAF